MVKAVEITSPDPETSTIEYTSVDDRDNQLTYSGTWQNDSSTSFYDNTARYTTDVGAYVEYTFTGSAIRWYGQKDTNFGSAQVYIDDALVETVNVNGTIAANQILYENTELEYGEHTIKIVCLSATIDIDRFAYGGNPVDANYITIEEVDDCVQYSDNWVLEQNSVFSGNTAKYTSVAGAYVEFTFTGTAVCWYGQNDVNFGEAKVYIDNELVSTVNVNGVAVTGKKLFEKAGLNRAEHTLKIVCETPVIDVDYFQYVE